jgi:hypothetical protein
MIHVGRGRASDVSGLPLAANLHFGRGLDLFLEENLTMRID